MATLLVNHMPQKTPVPVCTNWRGRELNRMLPVVTGDGSHENSSGSLWRVYIWSSLVPRPIWKIGEKNFSNGPGYEASIWKWKWNGTHSTLRYLRAKIWLLSNIQQTANTCVHTQIHKLWVLPCTVDYSKYQNSSCQELNMIHSKMASEAISN